MARKSFLAIFVGVAAIAVPNAFADKGGTPHDGSNGQGRPADQTQVQGRALAKGHAKTHGSSQATTHGKALAKGHAKTHGSSQATTHGKALAKGHAKTQAGANTQGPPATNTHAKAGKETICHATGSATNPYVTITISKNAIPAHTRHQDGRDIIPAPQTGCPTAGSQQQQQQQQQQEQEQEQANTPAGSSLPSAGQVLGETTSGSSAPSSSTSPGGQGQVLGATVSGKAPSASSSPSATATRPASSSSLPFTGTDAIIVAILGLAALLLGVTVRRAARAGGNRI